MTTLTTDENGAVYTQYLPRGEYCFKETKAPEGYVINEELFGFVVNEDGSVTCPKDTIEDMKIYGEIEIGKADAENSETMLGGAVFSIMNGKGEIVASVETDNNGIAVSDMLVYGDYTVVETSAPEGYNINAAVYPVSITYSGKVRVDVRDSAIKGAVKVVKLNAATHQPVPGAEFEIIDSAGRILERITTDSNGVRPDRVQ